jgi:NAD(P)-dependent dehydrogenase (short-subunit alcohol dehydrogenase family)
MSSSSPSCWLGLARRSAIVTGGNSGIGKAVVDCLRAVGCSRVTSLDLPDCDVTNREQVDAAMIKVMQQQPLPSSLSSSRPEEEPLLSPSFPRHATILVTCAGITRDNFVNALTEEDWDQVIDVNLKGTFNMCQSFLRHLPVVLPDAASATFDSADDDENDGTTTIISTASIINVGSIVSERGNLGQVNYAASKGGVLGLTRALAKEVASQQVRVNAILPGFIDTPMTATVPDKVLTNITSQRIALRRLGRPNDVANLVAFLASDRSNYITGTTIECSGMIAL